MRKMTVVRPVAFGRALVMSLILISGYAVAAPREEVKKAMTKFRPPVPGLIHHMDLWGPLPKCITGLPDARTDRL